MAKSTRPRAKVADRSQSPEPDPAGDARRVASQRDHHEGQGQHGHCGLEGRAPDHELQVLDHHEEQPERREELHHHGEAAGTEAAVAEQARVEHGLVDPQLPEHECDQRSDPDDEARHRERVAPAPLGALDDAEDGPGDGEQREQAADEVEPGRVRVHRAGHDEQRADQGDGGEHHVQGEERAPRVELEQEAAPEQAQDRAATGDTDPDADRPWPVLRRERRGDHRQRGRHDGGRPDAHERAQHDQLRRVTGEHSEPGGGAEYGEPTEQQPAAAEPVAEGAGEEQQAGEHDRVGVDDPGDLRLRGTGLPGQVRQGDVEAADGRDDGHQGERDDGKDGTGAGPGPGAAGGG
jgi:hypothetical protein